MISFKVCKRDNGSIKSILCQGHANPAVNASITILMQSCGHYIENNKSGIMDFDEREMIMISNIKQSKPIVAVVDVLLDGIESVARKNPYSVQIKYMWEEQEETK